MLVRVANPNRVIGNYFSGQNNFDRLFNSFFSDSVKPYAVPNKILRSTILDKRDHLLLIIEAPGFNKENIKISVSGDVITIKAFRKPEQISENWNIVRSERVFGSFERSFQLPSAIEQSKIDAEYKDGLLKIVLPKEEKAQPKEIVIK